MGQALGTGEAFFVGFCSAIFGSELLLQLCVMPRRVTQEPFSQRPSKFSVNSV